jgi:hypothetical protein
MSNTMIPANVPLRAKSRQLNLSSCAEVNEQPQLMSVRPLAILTIIATEKTSINPSAIQSPTLDEDKTIRAAAISSNIGMM